MDYQTIEDDNRARFDKSVTRLLNQGYELVGAPRTVLTKQLELGVFGRFEIEVSVYTQALVKKD